MSTIMKILAAAEHTVCRLHILPVGTWEKALASNEVNLYAGDLRPDLQQYKTYFGITPFRLSMRTINHDVTLPFPIPDRSVDRFQSEDVFEHVPLETMPQIVEEIFRVLKPGGLFRMSVPDYGFDVYANRSERDAQGNIVFDAGGGGRYENGEVTGGGHLWYPTLGAVRKLMENSPFSSSGRIEYLQGYEDDGTAVMKPIDYRLGFIKRTPDHDIRGQNPQRPVSVVVDAWKS